ncbi:MAG: cellulose synthase/poly-beta-1,6-N-acetylglucosamine synthase-like glycosyltransferase [Verrucomicrobiales bacterium]|jgi:cellulose synthase/poly-beta-1,6-N-acetylglucosamine synthase-like glycosyltransferase
MEWPQITWIVCYTLVALGLSGYGVHRFMMIYLYWKHRKDTPKPLKQFDELPFVTVQLPVFNEAYVVERLIRTVGELDYPKDKWQIQVLDDSTDDTTAICEVEAAALRAQGIDCEVIHRVNRAGYKAGALEEGMKTAKGDFIYVLDADFVPQKEVIHEMIHFFTDPRVGMVQTRWGHLNKEYSVLTKIQAMFLDGHHILEQTARSRSGRFFQFNGTGGMLRSSTIEDAGGWEHDTLTEDLDLSYRAQLKGWRFIYLKDVVTPAELPVDMDGFKSQQHRWTKGSIQCCKKVLFRVWKSEESLSVKMEATMHLTANFAYLLLGLMCFLIYPSEARPQLEWHWALLAYIPVFVTATLSVSIFYATAQSIMHRGKWLRDLIYLPLLLALGIGMSITNSKAVIEALLNKKSPFVRTPKYGIDRKKVSWKGLRYTALKSVAPVFEVLFAVYFTVLIGISITKGYWSSVPFLLLFQVGFCYVAWGSISQYLPKRWFGYVDNKDEKAIV